jgi:hypothetical protein
MDVSTGAVGGAFTSQRYCSGGPFPASGLTARTVNTCCCSLRSLYVTGDVQASGLALSREHSKDESDWSEVNSKVASVLSDGSGGSLVIVARGTTATTQFRVSVPPILSGPDAVAVRSNVCSPFAKSVYVTCPLSQLSAEPPSRVHSKVAGALAWKVNVAEFEATVSPSAGPAVIVTNEPL